MLWGSYIIMRKDKYLLLGVLLIILVLTTVITTGIHVRSKKVDITTGIVIGHRSERIKYGSIYYLLLAGKDDSGRGDTSYCCVEEEDYRNYKEGDVYPSGACFIAPKR